MFVDFPWGLPSAIQSTIKDKLKCTDSLRICISKCLSLLCEGLYQTPASYQWATTYFLHWALATGFTGNHRLTTVQTSGADLGLHLKIWGLQTHRFPWQIAPLFFPEWKLPRKNDIVLLPLEIMFQWFTEGRGRGWTHLPAEFSPPSSSGGGFLWQWLMTVSFHSAPDVIASIRAGSWVLEPTCARCILLAPTSAAAWPAAHIQWCHARVNSWQQCVPKATVAVPCDVQQLLPSAPFAVSLNFKIVVKSTLKTTQKFSGSLTYLSLCQPLFYLRAAQRSSENWPLGVQVWGFPQT